MSNRNIGQQAKRKSLTILKNKHLQEYRDIFKEQLKIIIDRGKK